MGSATGTVTGSQAHVVVAVRWTWAGTGPRPSERVIPPWLPPFRDTQISELSAEKWYGYQVKYEEYSSVERRILYLLRERLLHAGDGA
jgi:hypothetical protein